MPKHLYKVMNRCPRCQARGFIVSGVRGNKDGRIRYELSCACGNTETILKTEVRLAVISPNDYVLGFHHWTRGDVLLALNTHINWDILQVA